MKSIGRDEEDSGNINLMMNQQFIASDHANEKKTPGLGIDTDMDRSGSGGPFAMANNKNNTSSGNVTSTFKIEKLDEDAEIDCAGRKNVFD